MKYEITIAGFGGQGVLFVGKILAYAGMDCEKSISWLPSYGPEMRGGTANCSVIISDNSIASPIITTADAVIALNKPSLEKFSDSIKPGGILITDSLYCESKIKRNDITVCYIPAMEIAENFGDSKLENMVMLGSFIKNTPLFSLEEIIESIKEHASKNKTEITNKNIKMLKMGYDFK
ncbi:MAG: 2-oxoacid:acceptor oxidoreductase family protein [Oscillospiraceae bacterium]